MKSPKIVNISPLLGVGQQTDTLVNPRSQPVELWIYPPVCLVDDAAASEVCPLLYGIKETHMETVKHKLCAPD